MDDRVFGKYRGSCLNQSIGLLLALSEGQASNTSVSVVLDRYGHLYPDHDSGLIDAPKAHAQWAAAM